MTNNGKRKKDLITCVSISKDMRDRLAQLGTKSQTFEQIIEKLMPENSAEDVGENQNDE